MNKGTKQAIFILSLIPLSYLVGVLFHSFVEWQQPLWSPALWDSFTRGIYLLFCFSFAFYAYIFYDMGRCK